MNSEKIHNHIENCKFCFMLLTSINHIVELHIRELNRGGLENFVEESIRIKELNNDN